MGSGALSRLLIVDESRMARMTIIRKIREFYEFREEANGDAAWQTLVLDHAIELVVCALSLPVLDGDGLLQRIRASQLPRLAQMPVLMIASDNEAENERVRAHGASGFIRRDIGDVELLSCIGSLLKELQPKESPEHEQRNPETGIFTLKHIEWLTQQAISYALRNNGEVSLMVIGFDNASALIDEYGADLINRLQRHLISILSGKMHKETSIGHHLGSQLLIVSPETSLAACEAFSNRLCEAIHAASITTGNRRLNISISIGVGNSPADGVSSARALIDLVGTRLTNAQQAGGNRVLTGNTPAVPAMAKPAPTLEQALNLLREGRESVIKPHLPELGRQILPLLKLLNQELALSLPIAEMEKRLLEKQGSGEPER